MNGKKIIATEKQCIMQSYKRTPLVLVKGKGAFVWDSKGKKYLDFIGALATNPIGHANKELVQAITKQASKLINATNLYYTKEQVMLAQKLARLSGLKKCFFSNSGSEAVEIAIKLARQHTKKKGIITTSNAFHGRTFAALTATDNKKYKAFCEPLVPGFKKIRFGDASALEKAITKDTAAFLVEPIQGESGINTPPEGYLKEVRKICSGKKVLLILDEVQTGCGRTGKFFAYQNEGIKPDIVTVAKGIAGGMPMGVTIAGKGIEFGAGQQGSTFGGNSVSSAAANTTIDYIAKKKLVKNAAVCGAYFMQELEKLKEHKKIKEVRGRGLMIGLELKGKKAGKVAKICLENGLLVNPIAGKTLRFLPPLTVSKAEINSAVKILDKALSEAGV